MHEQEERRHKAARREQPTAIAAPPASEPLLTAIALHSRARRDAAAPLLDSAAVVQVEPP
jgi:hypothetical protein